MTALDWGLVGGDPAPGEPAAFSSLSSSFSRTARNAEDSNRQLARLASGVDSSIWKGEAADAFRDKIEELPEQLAKLTDSYASASGALATYARVLADLKARAEAAVARAGAARADEQYQAQSRDQAQVATPDAPTTAYDDAIEQARQRLRAAQAQVDAIRDEREGAENRLVGSLEDASDKGIQNDRWGGLKSFLKAIGDIADWVGVALLVIAVVVIVAICLTNPAGWAALGAALAAAGPLLSAAAWAGGIGFASRVGRFALGDDSIDPKWLAIEGALMAVPFVGGKLARAVRPVSGAGDDAVHGASGVSRVHPRTNVPFDADGFPVFESLHDFRLADDMIGPTVSDTRQMRVATLQLRTMLDESPALRRQFTEQQLADIAAGRARIDGLTWHHHQDGVTLQLVDRATHGATGHSGGRAVTGGRP